MLVKSLQSLIKVCFCQWKMTHWLIAVPSVVYKERLRMTWSNRFNEFSENFQTASDTPLPYFRKLCCAFCNEIFRLGVDPPFLLPPLTKGLCQWETLTDKLCNHVTTRPRGYLVTLLQSQGSVSMWNTHRVTVLPRNHKATGLHGYRVTFYDCETTYPRNQGSMSMWNTHIVTV